MKKAILRVLLIFFGLNVFTSCYGMPPGDWPEPIPSSEEQEQTESSSQSGEDASLEDIDETDTIESAVQQ